MTAPESASLSDEELWSRFQARTLASADWTHAAHLRVAWMHLARHALDEAHLRMRVGIIRLNLTHGLEETTARGYHETITRAWLELVAGLRFVKTCETSAAFLEHHAGALERDALLNNYSRERLYSLPARTRYLEPDQGLKPLCGCFGLRRVVPVQLHAGCRTMMRDAREKLQTLVNRATSPTDDDDNEARTAAVQACKLLAKHPELVATPQPLAPPIAAPQPAPEPAPPPKTESTIHPDAERLLEWRAMLKKKSLREGHAASPTLCADCGKPIAASEPVVEQRSGPIATHLACANWWWNFQPTGTASYDIAS